MTMIRISKYRSVALAAAGVAMVLAGASGATGGRAVAKAAQELRVGQAAPDFNLPDQDGRMHHLADYRGKTVILAFYPKDFTGG